MVQYSFPNPRRIRLWSVLEEEEIPIQALDLGSTTNTEPTEDKVHIPREIIGEWADAEIDPFPDFWKIKDYAQNHSQSWHKLDAYIRNEDYRRSMSREPIPVNSETQLEIAQQVHYDIVNLALERTQLNGRHVMIAGGKSATAGNKASKINSEPDRASFLAPESLLIYCFSELGHKGAAERQNLIPGEIKVSYKFRRSFLDATIEKNGRVTPYVALRQQAEQVFTQIYQYMNERNSAVGYVMTDQELICVRRTPVERCGLKYGVIDISPSIPLSVKRGSLNAKVALWYLHHKYGVNRPDLGHLRRTPKPRNWRQKVNQIIYSRDGIATGGRRVYNTRSSTSASALRSDTDSLDTNSTRHSSEHRELPPLRNYGRRNRR